MEFSVLLALRAVQAVFAIVILGLASFVVDWYMRITWLWSPSEFNFLIAAPIFTILSLLYLEVVSRFAPRASHPYVAFTVEVINVCFYFAGFIAASVYIGRLSFCRGSVCGAARALAVFTALNFVLWTATAVLIAKVIFKGGLRRHRDPPPVAPPQMQQQTTTA